MASTLVIGQVKEPLQWEHWGEAVAMLDPALALSDETWPSVIRELADGSMQLVGVMTKGGDRLLAAAILRTIISRSGHVLEIFICGGKDFQSWATELAEAITEGARKLGCVAVRTWGRPGWRAVFAPLGWKADIVCFEKAL